MDKIAIETFAIWARRKIIADVMERASLLGITAAGILDPLPQSTSDLHLFDIGGTDYIVVEGEKIQQRQALVKAIKKGKDHETAFNTVVEEIAFTWFNRLIALRFMEVNDYLPGRVRVLSSIDPAKIEPDIVTDPFAADLPISQTEKKQIQNLKEQNELDKIFRLLLVKQCNVLHEAMPFLFEKTADYSELLLPFSYTDRDGVVQRLIRDIAEEDFDVTKGGQVEIIGWFYQFYNSEVKDQVFSDLKKNIKITKDKIPAATQLFTPAWIVRYMVENSLGRLWVEGHPESNLQTAWSYFVDIPNQTGDTADALNEILASHSCLQPEDIKVIDPSMGSGHILVYAFEIMMQIYLSCGYTKSHAAKSIIRHNLYGLDIDQRAAQLANFAVIMKARSYHRRILDAPLETNLFAITDSRSLTEDMINFIARGDVAVEASLRSIAKDLSEAQEFGSIIDVQPVDFCDLLIRLEEISAGPHHSYQQVIRNEILPLVRQAQIMAQTYDVVVTNPPYMGSRNMSPRLTSFVKENYPLTKSDLFSVFIEKGNKMTRLNGFNCMVTMQSWMFLKSFEGMRRDILVNYTITSLLHLDNMVLGIAFGTAVAVLRKSVLKGFKGLYHHVKWEDIVEGEPVAFPVVDNRQACISSERFTKIPGVPIAYWISARLFEVFDEGRSLGELLPVRTGLQTGDNNRFLRLWWEVDLHNICFTADNDTEAVDSGKKWFPYNKGGAARKWYGNNDYIINWQDRGQELIGKAAADGRNVSNYPDELKFIPIGTWSLITSGRPTFRYKIHQLSDIAGMSFYKTKDVDEDLFMYILGFCNTKIGEYILEIISPTMNFQAGDVARLPIIVDKSKLHTVADIVRQCVTLAKEDWDAWETSWDFGRHPFIRTSSIARMAESWSVWQCECAARIQSLKEKEEALNRLFIKIYGLEDEFTAELSDVDVTLREGNLTRDVKLFISYAVGCMFGRFSLEGETFALTKRSYKAEKYILMLDEAYFSDDIADRFVSFVKAIYGPDYLEENLGFIASALNMRGTNSREKIRNYFLKDFYKDHLKIYQKRPIYWLFDSGRENGFKALAYIHHWDEDLIGRVRVEGLHRLQRFYENEINRLGQTVAAGVDSREKALLAKKIAKLTRQIKEVRDYDAKLGHLASRRLTIDLDDGIKVNHKRVQTAANGISLDILAKI